MENLILTFSTPFGVGKVLANTIAGSSTGSARLCAAGNDRTYGKGGNGMLWGQGDADGFERGDGGDISGAIVSGTDSIELSLVGYASFSALQAPVVQRGADSAARAVSWCLKTLRPISFRRRISSSLEPPFGLANALALGFAGMISMLAAQPAHADPDLMPYLVQAECLNEAGERMVGVLPFEESCARRTPVRWGAPLTYRRHDWPARYAVERQPLGYQAQDAVLGTLLGRLAVIHTFDFGGDMTRRFGVFDGGRGDGGQVVVIDQGEAYVVMTEDASGGTQWFRSPDCASGAPGWRGWLLAQSGAGREWAERVVRLRVAHTAEACPNAFDASYTRWRRASLELLWREASIGTVVNVRADIVISEHYGGSSIDDADHLERFFLARDLGLVRWERWQNRLHPRQLGTPAPTAADDGRCPVIEGSVPPGAGWAMADCRHWTNIDRARPGAMLDTLNWPRSNLH